MASVEGLVDKLKSAKKKKDKIYGTGKLERAYLMSYTSMGGGRLMGSGQWNVQFNPSEYSISRSVSFKVPKPLHRDVDPVLAQAISGEPSVLSVTLYFDSYTELAGSLGAGNRLAGNIKAGAADLYNQEKHDALPSIDMNEETAPDPDLRVNELCDQFLKLIRFASEEHAPPLIGFVWGRYLEFIGIVGNYTVQYKAFDRNGTPVRIQVQLTIVGEDKALKRDSAANPMNSPDRTKERTLGAGEQLWMMAEEEYGDVNHWKTIAEANGILNPRALKGTARLKVPSIQ